LGGVAFGEGAPDDVVARPSQRSRDDCKRTPADGEGRRPAPQDQEDPACEHGGERKEHAATERFTSHHARKEHRKERLEVQ
jgi:hypothetical protein